MIYKVTNSLFSFPTEEVIEGSIKLTVPKLELYSKGISEYIPSKAPVFYNPRMELNRDFAVLALKVFRKRGNFLLNVCDPLAGCGVRGIRFAREVNGIKSVLLNDMSSKAAALARFNAEKNALPVKVVVENMDARVLLCSYVPHLRFDVIDLDPYGSPSRFLDFALFALKNSGLLALTATDTAPLCGVNPKACMRKYFGRSLRTEYCHELGVRLLISSVAISAARYNRGTRVLFSHSSDHYIRVYLQIQQGVKRADESRGKIGYILHCFNCLHRTWLYNLTSFSKTNCEICGHKMKLAGPLWLGKLIDSDFCEEIYEQANETFSEGKKRLFKLLITLLQEADFPPTYFSVDKVCEKLKVSSTSLDRIIDNLVKMGYDATRTHFNPQGIKSNASISELYCAIKELNI